MSGQCIEKLPHKCGSSDGLQVFRSDRDDFSGYCFACDTYVPDPYADKEPGYKPRIKAKTDEEIAEKLREIEECQAIDLNDRCLSKETLDYFGIKVGLSEQDGSLPVFHYYPYTKDGEVVAYKVRLIEGKKMWSVGTVKGADLFGWSQALRTGAKKLFITEGELDAAALYQALKAKAKGSEYEHFDPAVVSLISGSGAARKDITEHLAAIRANFKEVVLVFDQDQYGKKAVEEVMRVLPDAAAATLPAKDANDCLIKGYSRAMCNAVLFKAEKPKNSRLVWGKDVIADARKQPEMGLEWPWKALTKYTRGIRFGETIYLGAGVKMGKSTLVATLAAHMITTHGLKVFLAQPEASNVETFKLVTGKVAGRIFHDPDVPFDFDAYDKAAPLVGDNLCMLNLYQNIDWNHLRTDITTSVENGCKAIFIDPITNLTNGISAADANTVLQEVAQELAMLAKDLNVVVFMFCHLKAPEAGAPHERGGKVYSNQFAGSRAMMRSCHLMLGLEGNKDPDLPPEEQRIRRLVILEDRAFGSSGYVSLYYDPKTGLYNEIPEVKNG